jgi:hypothetical protein
MESFRVKLVTSLKDDQYTSSLTGESGIMGWGPVCWHHGVFVYLLCGYLRCKECKDRAYCGLKGMLMYCGGHWEGTQKGGMRPEGDKKGDGSPSFASTKACHRMRSLKRSGSGDS